MIVKGVELRWGPLESIIFCVRGRFRKRLRGGFPEPKFGPSFAPRRAENWDTGNPKVGPFSGPKNAPIFWAPTLFIEGTPLGRGPFFGHVFGSGGSRFGGARWGHKSAAKNREWSCFPACFCDPESVRTHRTPMVCFSAS